MELRYKNVIFAILERRGCDEETLDNIRGMCENGSKRLCFWWKATA